MDRIEQLKLILLVLSMGSIVHYTYGIYKPPTTPLMKYEERKPTPISDDNDTATIQTTINSKLFVINTR
ncbi:hypothetical protein RR48_07268 [Papilio machaon]|uniref:Uncharacterized protein n=1 Tax=Papilio machaon TaxID=76193 RepID=A0A194RM87_PAPMA|nr:hypothetical protein RR48_07268 [Papilio machaon]